MFNSQSQQILARYFLLNLHIEHLHRTAISKTGSGAQVEQSNSDSFVWDRISHFEETMCLELKQKQEKIYQLNSYIKELLSENSEISKQYQLLHQRYQQVQELGKNKQNINSCSANLGSTTVQEQQFHISFLEKQKQQMTEQINRMAITVKQLQADIQILNKENQSYIASINNYRLEESKHKQEKVKLQEEMKRLDEMIKNERKRNEKDLELRNREQQKSQQNERKLKKQIEKTIKNYTVVIDELKQKNAELQKKWNEQCKVNQKNIEEIERKSKKLREYDEQYNMYLARWNNLNIETVQSKQESAKMKEEYENILKTQRQKYQTSINKLFEQNKKEKEKIMIDFSNKMKKGEELVIKQKGQITIALQNEVQSLKQKIENITKDNENKLVMIGQQKSNAIKQWEELLVEMEKQKNIINQLLKQLENQRKISVHSTITQSQFNRQNDHIVKQDHKKLMNHSLLLEKQSNILRNENNQNDNRITNKTIIQYSKCIDTKTRENKSSSSPHNKFFRANTSESETQHQFKTRKSGCHDKVRAIPQQAREETSNEVQSSSQQYKQCKKNIGHGNHQNSERRFEYLHQFDNCQEQKINLQNFRSNSLQNKKKSHLQQSSFPSRHDIIARGQIDNQFQIYQCQRLKKRSTDQSNYNISHRRKEDQFKKYQISKVQSNTFNNNHKDTLLLQKPKCFFKDVTNSTEKDILLNNIQKTKKGQLQQTNQKQRNISLTNYYRQQQQNKLSDSLARQKQEKLMKSSSLNRVNIDSHLKQIQKYLTFDLVSMKQPKNDKNILKSTSDRKLQNNSQPQSERLKVLYGLESDQKQQRNILMEKISKIHSYRGSQANKLTKISPNLYKRSSNQISSRIGSMGPKMRGEKENITNDIIYRNCQYINQR